MRSGIGITLTGRGHKILGDIREKYHVHLSPPCTLVHVLEGLYGLELVLLGSVHGFCRFFLSKLAWRRHSLVIRQRFMVLESTTATRTVVVGLLVLSVQVLSECEVLLSSASSNWHWYSPNSKDVWPAVISADRLHPISCFVALDVRTCKRPLLILLALG